MTMAAPMTADQPHNNPTVAGDTSEHVTEARHRARAMLAGETHLGAIDDWRRVLVSARDAMLFVWLVWVGLNAFGSPPFTGMMLVVMAVALAVLVGISTGRATLTQVQYFAAELDRERAEIRDDIEHERAEVRVLYAAKGFTEPLLEQIVDTLSADDDRLLKVMMEEELGLSMQHIQHPLIVGLWNFGGALVAGCALVLPIIWLSQPQSVVWITAGGATILMMLAIVAARVTGRTAIEFFTVGMLMAVVAGGVVHFLAQWFADQAPIAGV